VLCVWGDWAVSEDGPTEGPVAHPNSQQTNFVRRSATNARFAGCLLPTNLEVGWLAGFGAGGPLLGPPLYAFRGVLVWGIPFVCPEVFRGFGAAVLFVGFWAHGRTS